MHNIENRITLLLLKIGIPPHLTGYKALQKAIRIAYNDEKILYGKVTKELYPMISNELGSDVTAAQVERVIRHAIEITFKRRIPVMFENCVDPLSGKMTNSEFISRCTEFLRTEDILGE